LSVQAAQRPCRFFSADKEPWVIVQESDGSWEDLSDEEREAEAARRRAKGKLPLEGPVLEEIERQEAEMRAKQQDSDSD
jgi:hypothetical protein